MSSNFISLEAKVIAVDFDGTIVEHDYPKIGDEMLFAFDTLKALQKQGHKLILWTFRTGQYLDEAVAYCKSNGIEFYAVNKNFPEENPQDPKTSRKVNADIFIDDRNVGGFLGWGTIYQMLHPEDGDFNHQVKNPDAHHNYKKQKKGFLSGLFKK
jgi:hydroxymethylpyrimidine pyrophosphatase-like HAD family hydrolase